MAEPLVTKILLIDGFMVDASISENHEYQSEVTMHPVEKGSDISDHVITKPFELTINGIVSNTPIGQVAEAREQDLSPVEQCLTKFRTLFDDKRPITIETGLRVYRNMVIKSLSIPRSARTGDAVNFTASFVQIELVTSERTQANIEIPRIKKKRDRGGNSSKNIDSNNSTTNKDGEKAGAQAEDTSILGGAGKWVRKSELGQSLEEIWKVKR